MQEELIDDDAHSGFDVIAGWKSDLNWVLHVFDVCSACLRSAATDFPS